MGAFSPLWFSPDIYTLSQGIAPVGAHLLATISLSVWQHKDTLNRKPNTASDIRQNGVNRDASARIAHVIVHDNHRSSALHDSEAFSNNASHLVKVTFHHSRNSI